MSLVCLVSGKCTCVDPCALSSTVKIYCFQKEMMPRTAPCLKTSPATSRRISSHTRQTWKPCRIQRTCPTSEIWHWMGTCENIKQVKQVLKVSHVPFRLTQSLLKMLIWMMSARNQLTIDKKIHDLHGYISKGFSHREKVVPIFLHVRHIYPHLVYFYWKCG